jgi:ATP-dependent DNA ligase
MDSKIYNQEFPEIYKALEKLLHKNVVLDGEIVAAEPNGRPDFNALQNRRSTKLPIYYVAFDCLHFKGRDLLDKPIEERKRYLAEISEDFIKPMQPIFEFGPEVNLETATSVVRQMKIEGLVAKRLGSKYHPGIESDLWLKRRFNQEGKFFIGGYIRGSKDVGELLIGEYRENGKLHFIKRLIAGLNQFNRPEIFKAVQDLKTSKVPFVNLPERKAQHHHAVTEEVMAQVQWLRPEQAAEIEFVERTPHGGSDMLVSGACCHGQVTRDTEITLWILLPPTPKTAPTGPEGGRLLARRSEFLAVIRLSKIGPYAAVLGLRLEKDVYRVTVWFKHLLSHVIN